ncbi:hypothetical protein CXB77_04125 [Chromatium okenii]|uniref:Uncharacterized protein n=1 Tax=Chromatium okenii TaxID=61644 RepID=A0A2S7XUG2_9GAMM|nr:hypothetical protein CXB77_04125 [Chromatium okenii]
MCFSVAAEMRQNWRIIRVACLSSQLSRNLAVACEKVCRIRVNFEVSLENHVCSLFTNASAIPRIALGAALPFDGRIGLKPLFEDIGRESNQRATARGSDLGRN